MKLALILMVLGAGVLIRPIGLGVNIPSTIVATLMLIIGIILFAKERYKDITIKENSMRTQMSVDVF